MGATVRPREFDADQPSHTEQLSNWISRVRSKKLMCRRNRKRNLRVEAVLTSVLSKAEHELRNKQISRIMRWQQMKQRLFDDMAYKNGGYTDDECKNGDFQNGSDCLSCPDKTSYYSGIYSQNENVWTDVCPELSSLDSFMSQLSEIKIPLQRWRKLFINMGNSFEVTFSKKTSWHVFFRFIMKTKKSRWFRSSSSIYYDRSLLPGFECDAWSIIRKLISSITLEYIWIFFTCSLAVWDGNRMGDGRGRHWWPCNCLGNHDLTLAGLYAWHRCGL